MKTLLRNRELSALLAILALFALLIALNPAWFNLQILAMIFASSQILCLLALGATLVMLTRNIDVSVGSTVAFSGMVAVMASNATGSILMGLIAALLCGGAVGLVNGVVIARFRINALITTLATMQIVRGLALIASDGRARSAWWRAW